MAALALSTALLSACGGGHHKSAVGVKTSITTGATSPTDRPVTADVSKTTAKAAGGAPTASAKAATGSPGAGSAAASVAAGGAGSAVPGGANLGATSPAGPAAPGSVPAPPGSGPGTTVGPGSSGPAPYSFAPAPSASGPAAATSARTSDLTLPGGQTILFSFAVTSPGSASLHAFSSSTTTYDPSNLRACLQAASQPTCSPAPFPNPAYWQISADDLNHSRSYQLRVVAVQGSSALFGLGLGWNGPHQLDVGGLNLPGGCSGSTGYKSGCGMKFRFTTGGGGSATVAVSPAGLHLSVTNKSTGAKVFSGVVNGSATFGVSGGNDYEGHLYPESGGSVPGAHLNWSWP